MAILMMVVIVGLMLSALLIPAIVTQARNTRFDSTRVQALDAAQSGIDVALGMVRASVTDGIGDSGKLPCGPLSGAVDANSAAAYRVVIEYFTFDPLVEPDNSSRAMRCVPDLGTVDTASGATTPGFARIASTGTVGGQADGSTVGRTLSTTYVFRTGNVGLLGGTIAIGPAEESVLCMDVGSAAAPAGSAIVLQACSQSTPPAAQQVFAYRSDLTLQLLSSITAANSAGLCVNSTGSLTKSRGTVRLTPCGTLGAPAAYTQQWSYNDKGQFEAALATSSVTGALSGLCLNVSVQAVNQVVSLGTCGSSWLPAPSVGSGAAGLPQWVNAGEFDRCLDVPGQDAKAPFLIAYPCQQNPFPGAKTWNQSFRAPAIPAGQASVTGQLSTNNGAAQCLTSSAVNGGYVTIRPCVDGNPQQDWTSYDGDNALNHSAKYTVVNGALCLGLGAPNAAVPQWSTVVVEACTGTDEQKWNANPNVLNSTVQNTFER
jgi:hypothetical protein